MAIEIEHKFLIISNSWKNFVERSSDYKQGYLVSDASRSVRIRLSDNCAWLNIKSATIGIARQEYEYEIPREDGLKMLDSLCEKPFVEKTRYFVPNGKHLWEIDVFSGDNDGLVVAEIELSEVGEHFDRPSWLGKEVTEELKYYNNSLCKNPYKHWA